MKNRLLLCALLLTGLVLYALSGQALSDVSVCPPGQAAQSVSWYQSGSLYYLLLPASFDTDALEIHFSGEESITVNGTQVADGDICSLPVDETFKIGYGKKSVKVQVMQGSAIPSLFVTTASGSLTYIEKSKSNKEAGTILILDEAGETISNQNLTSIKCRGNASFRFIKKNYQIKLESGKNLFGMGKSKTWILTGNYRDKSHLRNRITYDLAIYAGLAYTPESLSVNLYVNGEYRGVYLLSEKIQIGKNRVAINDLEEQTEALNGGDLSVFDLLGSKAAKKKMGKYYAFPADPEDITGGYLVEMRENSTHYKEATSAYFTARQMTADFHSPKYLSQAQYTYITSLLQSFENAIFASDGIDAETGRHYSEIADTDSLVRKYMIEEISKNYDGNHSSQYFYKPSDSQSTLLYAGPVWDYDSAYGTYGTNKSFLSPKGFSINSSSSGKSWWTALYKHTEFQEAVRQCWVETFLPGLNILLGEGTDESGRLKSIAEYAEEIADSVHMDLIRWPKKKSSLAAVQDTGKNFEENIEFLTNYITTRRDWLKTQWGE